MATGYSAQNLARKLKGKQLQDSTTRKIINSLGDDKLPTSQVKGKVVSFLKYKSERKREKVYEDWELNNGEKDRLEKNISVGKTLEELRKEKELAQKKRHYNVYSIQKDRREAEGDKKVMRRERVKAASNNTANDLKARQAFAKMDPKERREMIKVELNKKKGGHEDLQITDERDKSFISVKSDKRLGELNEAPQQTAGRGAVPTGLTAGVAPRGGDSGGGKGDAMHVNLNQTRGTGGGSGRGESLSGRPPSVALSR